MFIRIPISGCWSLTTAEILRNVEDHDDHHGYISQNWFQSIPCNSIGFSHGSSMDHPSGGWFLGGPWRWSFWSSQPGSLCPAHGIGTEGIDWFGMTWIWEMNDLMMTDIQWIYNDIYRNMYVYIYIYTYTKLDTMDGWMDGWMYGWIDNKYDEHVSN